MNRTYPVHQGEQEGEVDREVWSRVSFYTFLQLLTGYETPSVLQVLHSHKTSLILRDLILLALHCHSPALKTGMKQSQWALD